jgi:diadenosine tetraphosphate (Ap4A) HIT family hydrolase
MDECIFCKIIKGEIPSFKVYEDDEFIGILDINPNTPGVTLIIPKEHSDSYIFRNNNKLISKIMNAAKKTAVKLESSLKVKRVSVVFEGMGIDHLHVKLFPMHGLKEEYEAMEHGTQKVYFEKYPGFITTQIGEQADFKELKDLADKINT